MIPQKKENKFFKNFGLTKSRDEFIENLNMLMNSGMSITGAISSIAKETRNTRMKKILEEILFDIESGSAVWKALLKTELFKDYTISLIRLGEESGKFLENLKVVTLELEKNREFSSKVRSALMYPAFVLGLTGFIGVGISWFILPKLAKVFDQLNIKLPLITKLLIGFGVFLGEHGKYVVPLVVIFLGVLAYFIFVFPKTKEAGEIILFSLPGVKGLMAEVEIARFGYLLGTLLDAGLQVTQAIDSLASASSSIRYKRFYEHLRDSVDMGNSFEKSFTSYKKIDKLIPTAIQQLVISGEQSGNLHGTLLRIGQVMEEKSETTTKNLTIIMEPVLLIIVWAGVVSVAFAVILPIYSLVGGISPS